MLDKGYGDKPYRTATPSLGPEMTPPAFLGGWPGEATALVDQATGQAIRPVTVLLNGTSRLDVMQRRGARTARAAKNPPGGGFPRPSRVTKILAASTIGARRRSDHVWREVEMRCRPDARRDLGIALVTSHLGLIPSLSVLEKPR